MDQGGGEDALAVIPTMDQEKAFQTKKRKKSVSKWPMHQRGHLRRPHKRVISVLMGGMGEGQYLKNNGFQLQHIESYTPSIRKSQTS